jgi:hypothetical protein
LIIASRIAESSVLVDVADVDAVVADDDETGVAAAVVAVAVAVVDCEDDGDLSMVSARPKI